MQKVIHAPKIGTNKKFLEHADSAVDDAPQKGRHQRVSNSPIPIDDYAATQQAMEALHGENDELKKQYELLQKKHNTLVNEIDNYRTLAKKEGYEEGLSKAEEETKSAIDAKFSACEAFINELKEKVLKDLYNQEEICLEIVYSAICRLIGDSAGTRGQIEAIVRLTIGKVASQENLDIYVSPHDYPQLMEDKLIAGNLIQSDELKYGGCLIKTGRGRVEARLDRQLDQLKALLSSVHSVQGHLQRDQ